MLIFGFKIGTNGNEINCYKDVVRKGENMKEFILHMLKRAIPWGIGFLITGLCLLISFLLNGENEIFEELMVITLLLGIILFAHILIIIVFCTPGVIGKIFGKISRKKIILDETDFENSKEYYREILKVSSPLIVGYLDSFKLDFNNIIAELLYLKNKKIIDIKDGKIEKINEADYSGLKYSELEILHNLANGKLKINNYDDYLFELRKMVAKEAEQLLLVNEIKKRKYNLERFKKIIIISSFIADLLISFFLSSVTGWNNGIFGFFGFMLCGVIISMIFGMIIFFSFKEEYEKNRGELYKRTSKGRELNQKLEGLKNYLKDYSLMDEREAKEIELWDDYLIYSVMFGQNKKIIEEYEKYIEIIE